MTFDILLTADLAEAFEVSPQYVRDHHEQWSRDVGFPQPLPIGKRPRWDAEAVKVWLQRCRPEALRTMKLADDVRHGPSEDPAEALAKRIAARRMDATEGAH